MDVGCARKGWLQGVGAALLCGAKQGGRRTGWFKWVDGEERGREGGSLLGVFVRGTEVRVDFCFLPTEDVGSTTAVRACRSIIVSARGWFTQHICGHI